MPAVPCMYAAFEWKATRGVPLQRRGGSRGRKPCRGGRGTRGRLACSAGAECAAARGALWRPPSPAASSCLPTCAAPPPSPTPAPQTSTRPPPAPRHTHPLSPHKYPQFICTFTNCFFMLPEHARVNCCPNSNSLQVVVWTASYMLGCREVRSGAGAQVRGGGAPWTWCP